MVCHVSNWCEDKRSMTVMTDVFFVDVTDFVVVNGSTVALILNRHRQTIKIAAGILTGCPRFTNERNYQIVILTKE